ncbi:MAG: hypothetical protein ABSH34_07090 [Verrucomicrobiota bacterium]
MPMELVLMHPRLIAILGLLVLWGTRPVPAGELALPRFRVLEIDSHIESLQPDMMHYR